MQDQVLEINKKAAFPGPDSFPQNAHVHLFAAWVAAKKPGWVHLPHRSSALSSTGHLPGHLIEVSDLRYFFRYLSDVIMPAECNI